MALLPGQSLCYLLHKLENSACRGRMGHLFISILEEKQHIDSLSDAMVTLDPYGAEAGRCTLMTTPAIYIYFSF